MNPTSTKLMRALSLAAATAMATSGSIYAQGPQPYSHLFITAYNNSNGCGQVVVDVQNTTVRNKWTPVGGDCNFQFALAVYNKIKTIGVRPPYYGAEYTLFGVPTDATYDYPTQIYMDIPDGTTDGSKNYAGGYFDGYVYQFSKDWKDPVALFPTGLYLGGITYDSTNGTLWVLDSRDEAGGVVRNYQKNGTLVSEFSVVVRPGEQAMGLALDPADQKLWLSRHNTGNPFGSPFVLESYSKTGEPIDRITLNKLSGYQAVGMEFRVPVKMK